MTESIYTQIRKIHIKRLFSLDIYRVKPGGSDGKHHHNCFEIIYVIKGNCQTHNQGHFYVYRKGQIHELTNNSKEHLVIACLTIPPESEKNTVYAGSTKKYLRKH